MPIPAAVPLIAGAIGSLKGIFTNRRTPTMADVNLARDNPELWKQLQELQTMNAELDRQYAIRREGATQGEMAQMAEARSQAYERQGNQGLIGTSAGAGMMGKQEGQMQNALQDRIFNERNQMLQAALQGKQNYMNQLNSAQQAALAQRMGAYQGQQQEDQASNQFFGGLVNSGMGMLGQQEYMKNLQDPLFRQNLFEANYGIPGQAPMQGNYSTAPAGFNYSDNRRNA